MSGLLRPFEPDAELAVGARSRGPGLPPAPPTRPSGACPLSVSPRGGKAGGEGAHEGRPYEMGGATRRVLKGLQRGKGG